jgi:hypothetical protein
VSAPLSKECLTLLSRRRTAVGAAAVAFSLATMPAFSPLAVASRKECDGAKKTSTAKKPSSSKKKAGTPRKCGS